MGYPRVVIAYPLGKSRTFVAAVAAAALLAALAGCSLTYVQGPDHQRLEVEIMRPIDVNHNEGGDK